MKNKIIFVLFIFFLLVSILTIAQEPPNSHRWKIVYEKPERKHHIFDEPNGYIIQKNQQVFNADITMLVAIIPDFQVNIKDISPYPTQRCPAICTESSGNFVITWEDERNGDYDIYAQRFSSDGSAVGGNFRVTHISGKRQFSPDVSLWNDHIYSTWTDTRVGGTRFDIWANVLDWDNPVGISDEEPSLKPSTFILIQNYPNPFNLSTQISYSIAKSGFVILKIYDMLGREIKSIVNEFQKPGTYVVNFNASEFSSGIFLYKLLVGSVFVEIKKMMFLR